MNPFRVLRSTDGEHAPGTGPAHDGPDEASQQLRGAARGDAEAFARFYDLMAPSLYGVVLKVVRAPSLAEEITQDVFVELWRLAPRYDPSRGSARTWAATVAHRRAVDRVRSEAAARAREERDGRRTVAPHDSVVEEIVSRLDHERVASALASLTATQREAVTLAYYGGNTYREVALLLDVPEGTVKTRIRDGLIKLRDLLEVTT